MLRIDELNILGLLGADKKRRRDDFIDLLIDAYLEGFVDCNGQLGTDSRVDEDLLRDALERSYDGRSIYDILESYTDDPASAERLVGSEMNRAYNQGGLDCATESGMAVRKTWVTMGDEKVRDTHDYLEGVSVPLDAEFYTYDGDHALAPGGFTSPANNANCRCILRYSSEQ